MLLYDNETKEQKMLGGLPMQVWHAPTAKETCNAASRVCVLPTGAAYFSDFPRFSCSGVSRCGSVSPLTLESLLILWDPSVSLPNSVNVLKPARTDVHGITTQNRSIVYSHVNYSEENSWLCALGSRTKIYLIKYSFIWDRSSIFCNLLNVKNIFQRKGRVVTGSVS